MIPDDMLPPSDDSDADNDHLLSANPNRPLIQHDSYSEDSEEEENEKEESEVHHTRNDVHFN